MKFLIGGEHFYSPSIYFKKKSFDLESFLNVHYLRLYHYMTYGGYFSILAILKHININNDQVVLLPSYLCPTVLIPFKRLNINYRFYNITETLRIDTVDLLNKIDNKVKAVLFINYFGIINNTQEIRILKENISDSVILIEDMVQNLFSKNIIGDFAFNSFRKFFPLEGSIIVSKEQIKAKPERSSDNYFYPRLKGRYLRYIYSHYKINTVGAFLSSFEEAEKRYYQNKVMGFSNYNKFILSKINLETITSQRINNYNYLLERFLDYALFKEPCNNSIPLGFPVLVENREKTRKTLMNKNIFCPVHWVLSDEIDKNQFRESWELSKKILTIPINQYIKEKELAYLIRFMEDII